MTIDLNVEKKANFPKNVHASMCIVEYFIGEFVVELFNEKPIKPVKNVCILIGCSMRFNSRRFVCCYCRRCILIEVPSEHFDEQTLKYPEFQCSFFRV